MSAAMNVFVNIGARIGASFNSSVRQAETRLERMGRRLEITGAKVKAFGSDALSAIGVATAAGYGFSRAMRPFVEFEDGLVRLGNVAEISGPRLDAVGQRIIDTGAKYGIGGRQALAGAQDFLAAGLKIETALAALDPTLKLARVAGIEDAEASQVGIAAMQNLGVRDTQLGAAYDIMAKAGKLGRFEVDDLAKALPGLASRAGALGMSGLDGVRRISAQAQIARESARDADEAANNLLNFYDKLSSGETQRKFAKMGLSVEGVFAQSKAEGTDFVDAMLDEIGRLTKGGTDAFAMSALFEDRQARQGAAALVRERAKLQAIYAGTGNASGTLDTDFANIASTTKFGLDRFAAGLERVGIAFGRAFGPMLGDAAMGLATLMERFANFAERNPAVIRTIGLLVGGFIGLKAAVLGGAWVMGSVIGSIGGFITRLTGLWRATLGARMALAMLARFGLGAILAVSWPVAAAIAAIGLGLAWIIAKWDGIKAFFSGFAKGFAQEMGPALSAFSGAWDTLKVAMAPLEPLFAKVREAFGWIFGPPAVEGWSSAGEVIGRIVGRMARIIGVLAEGAARAVTAVGKFFGVSESMPSALGAPRIGARALGGSISAGRPYLVGERGPEMVVPGRSGTVIPAHAVAAMRQGGSTTVTNHFVINGATDPQATVREIERYMSRMAVGQSALLSD